MTLITLEPPFSTHPSSDPTEILKSQEHPTYCGICACPCLTPRLPTPLPHDPDPAPTKLQAQFSLTTPPWLHQYHHLQPSRGILPFPFDPLTHPQTDERSNPHRRIVPIHLYCLRAVLDVVKVGMYGCGTHQEESIMMGYSVPRYVGFGPWVDESLRRTERPEMSWMGLEDQRARWVYGIKGSHLRASDLHDPTILDDPMAHAPPACPSAYRPVLNTHETDAITTLPPCIISNIAPHILRLGDDQPIKPAKRLDDLLSLCRSTRSFREIDLPHSTWAGLTMQSVNRYRDELMKRWRANPMGTGGSGQVWIALDNAFVVPVEKALQRAKEANQARAEVSVLHHGAGGGAGNEGDALMARDVLYWWLYSEAWRSRRRVWRCAVFASAAARNADWW